MVTLGSKRIHVVFADSRGGDLQEIVDKINCTGEHMEINEYKGATFEELVGEAERYLPLHLFDVIYIAGGVNNITSKNRRTKAISYNWERGDALQDHLVSILTRADDWFKKYFPASKIVFCPLVGSELRRIVNTSAVTCEDQLDVENAVWAFNTKVFEINDIRNTKCPILQHQVHRFCKGKRRAYYHHLGDGIHLSADLKSKWAHQFVKAMAQN